jgi:3-hydroxyacyl-CoA dehydrogenase
MSVVSLSRNDDVAVITIDNPPVNALKHEVRAGLTETLAQARDDASVRAVVIACAGRTFVAGADITEFGKPRQPPSLSDVIVLLESMQKPVVAAIHGTALGGGLELALGCHYRVAAPGSRLGLPEIKLGIIPGGGGTQRLPRLIGMEKAFPMILSGEPIGAKDAYAAGLVDEIVDGDLTAGAVAFARRAAGKGGALPRIRDRDDKLAALKADPKKFDDIVAANLKRTRGMHAPAKAVDALRAAFERPFDDGLQVERDVFSELVSGDQSKAQRHLFFAEREALKIPDLQKDVKPREIARAVVLGAGTMGGGISMCFANAGIPVTVIEASQEALDRGFGIIRRNYENTMKRGGLSQEEMERRLALFSLTTDFDKVAEADIVVEAVFEEMDLKKEVFGKLDRVAKPNAVLASNTSYLNVDEIAQATKRPGSVLGMHFFSPANVMKLLEIVRGKETAPDVLATAMAVGRRIGKVPTVVGVCHGFVGNRMLRARAIEAERLLLEGALPHEVDGALTEFGLPMGPFQMGDLAGLDVSWRIRKATGLRAEVADTLCEAGRFGQKTGKGFYIYEGGSRTAIPDPEVEQIIVNASRRLGIARRPIGKEEIVERLIFPMINEGARILEEGIALRPGDIDVIYVYGYGWPVWRGGPMFYADHVGLPYIRDRLTEFAKASGNKSLEPAPLLAQLAAEGRGFGSLGLTTKKVA